MSDLPHEVARRMALKGIACLLLPQTAGCAHETKPICPNSPVISDRDAPLTIDVHAHVFNGRDLQIQAFLTQVAGSQKSELSDLVSGLGSAFLQALAWSMAPGAPEERRAIVRYQSASQEICRRPDALRAAAAPSFEDGYQRGLTQLKLAKAQIQATPESRHVLGPRDDREGEGIGAAIDELPARYEDYLKTKNDQASIMGSQPHVVGYLDFVFHHFNYRHVNALDYLQTYSGKSMRKVDLLIASMVDYDYWLANGRSTPTTLEEQVDLMSQVSELTQGRVHGFVPFCPFREILTRRGTEPGASMRLVKRAILEQGCIGVKLYPPMGFAPWGNASLNIWRGKKGLPPAAADPTFGRQLDEAMERLFIWCLEEDVPVMAHTNRSNAPFEDFRALAGAEYWERALQRFKGLRVNFGHFGDTDLEDHEGKVSDGFVRLMSRNSAAAGSRAFADSSYFAGVLTQAPAVTKTLLNLYAKSDQDVLVERLMYGSDWTMILPQKRVDQYLAEFIEVMTQIQHELRPRPPVSGSLTDAFFGRNATAYLGLAKGAKARGRLESFYARRRVATPDWMRKVG